MCKKFISKILIIFSVLFLFSPIAVRGVAHTCFAMPFYDLQPENIVLRASFYTSYSSSSLQRKNNIILASKALNNVLVDVNAEFSFNKTVGPRTEKRGYKNAKIIVNGAFKEGVGGGVCQVSSTLYNAVLLSGLKITEYHPHSLPVGYVAPSFDAMVNSGSADLRFVNNTNNPIYIKSYADLNMIKIEIYGQQLKEKYSRESEIIEQISATETEILKDTLEEYPELKLGEQKVLSYGKNGYRSKGYLIKSIDGKVISKKLIRTDYYKPTKTIIIEGMADIVEDNSPINLPAES